MSSTFTGTPALFSSCCERSFDRYSGLIRGTDSQSPPDSQEVLGYEAYQYGPFRESWTPGFIQEPLPTGLTRYITNGAGVSIPSQNLGFYFGGMRGANWGAIEATVAPANVTANTLIEVDMSTMRAEKWTNHSLPNFVPGRANAELVWIPVSQSGVLVAIGGVVNPEEIYPAGPSPAQQTQSVSDDCHPITRDLLAVFR